MEGFLSTKGHKTAEEFNKLYGSELYNRCILSRSKKDLEMPSKIF